MLHSTDIGTYCLILALAFQAESHAQLAHLGALENVSVQEELQLSGEQTQQITEILKEYRAESLKAQVGESRGPNRHENVVRIGAGYHDRVAKLLEPRQSQRLQEIALQYAEQSASRLFARNPILAEAVGLEERQRQQIRDIYLAPLPRQAARNQEETNRDQQVMAVFTEAQREQLDRLRGEDFESGRPIDIFRRNDHNDDGKVEASEASVPFWNSYAEFDTDSDEAVGRVEFLAGVTQRGVEYGRDTMRALFDRNDKKQDGTLSQEEANPFFRSMDWAPRRWSPSRTHRRHISPE